MKGVGWKASVQNYRNKSVSNIATAYLALHKGAYKSKGFYEFDIIERGKPRHIQSVHISERVVQRCLCDYGLVPTLTPKLVYDNGACIKDKGIDFALDRMTVHLKRYYARYHTNEGYALMTDFSKYFENINHEQLIRALTKVVTDEKTMRLISQLIHNFGGDKGLGLGSQISQVCALYYPTSLDRFIQEKMGISLYGRYMDDSRLIHPSKEHLTKCLSAIRAIAIILGIKMNPKKTQVMKIKNGLIWLKMRFVLTETGAVYRKPSKKSITRMRRKLKKFKQWLLQGKMTMEEIDTSYQSWKGHIGKASSRRTVKEMDNLYDKLFKEVHYGSTTRIPVH